MTIKPEESVLAAETTTAAAADTDLRASNGGLSPITEASSVPDIDQVSNTSQTGTMTPAAITDDAASLAADAGVNGTSTVTRKSSSDDEHEAMLSTPDKSEANELRENTTDTPKISIKKEVPEADYSVINSASSDVLANPQDVEAPSPTQTVTGLDKASGVTVTSYHIDADLYVKVRASGGIAMYKVYSALIAAASPVWRKMVYRGDYPRPTRGKWMIEMLSPEDDPFGLDVLFSMIHYKYHEIPGRPDINQLYGIARVVEKYDCAHLLVPFMEKWVTGLNWHIIMNDSKQHNDDDKTLFLTWVLGEGRWFSRVVSRVAYKATVNGKGALLDAAGQSWENQGLPATITEMITTTRAKALAKMLPAVSIPLQELLDAPRERVIKFCRAKDAAEETKDQCQLQQLGSLVSCLTIAGLMPIPHPEKYLGSVDELAKKILSLKVTHYKIPGVKPHQDTHNNCGIHHKEAVADAMPSAIQLNGQLIQGLKDRAQRSGAFSEELFRDLKVMERSPSPSPSDDLRENSTHFKQTEDFVTAPDYYSESFGEVVIKVEDVDA